MYPYIICKRDALTFRVESLKRESDSRGALLPYILVAASFREVSNMGADARL